MQGFWGNKRTDSPKDRIFISHSQIRLTEANG